MRRRAFIAGLGGSMLAQPVHAQGGRPPARIGYLSGSSPPDRGLEYILIGLGRLGYRGGRDFVIEERYADRNYARFPALVEELLRSRIDIMVVAGPAMRAAPLAARSVPVVFVFSGDPVDAGFVSSFARPGGNMTGVSLLQLHLAAKRVELIKEAAPTITRLAILSNPNHPGEPSELQATRRAAEAQNLAHAYFTVRDASEFGPAFAAIQGAGCDAMLTFPEAVTVFHRAEITAFAREYRLPTVFGWKIYAEAGGLMAYGPDLEEAYARAGFYIDRILKGTHPGNLPIEQPTRIELVANLRTSKAIGLPFPQSLTFRADEVIE